MMVRVAGNTLTGRAIDLGTVGRVDLTLTDVTRAIRIADENDVSVPVPISIDCPTPGPVHEHVGVIRAGMEFRRGSALAAAARSRGHNPPQADELAAIRDRLDSLDAPAIDLRRARRRVAAASDAEAKIRERVATLQGRVQALREAWEGDETTEVNDAEAELAETTCRLSEVETERIAAEQALTRAREEAQANREVRRERLRLQDRAANLRRAAREQLAETVRESFEDARDDLPEGPETSTRTALAVARVAALDAPVVLARNADPFESVEGAAQWLDGAVVLV